MTDEEFEKLVQQFESFVRGWEKEYNKDNPKIIKDQAMKPKKLGILILFSSAIALTMKLGALPMYVNAPINTAPIDIASKVSGILFIR